MLVDLDQLSLHIGQIDGHDNTILLLDQAL